MSTANKLSMHVLDLIVKNIYPSYTFAASHAIESSCFEPGVLVRAVCACGWPATLHVYLDLTTSIPMLLESFYRIEPRVHNRIL
jgi:hypothetical protein